MAETENTMEFEFNSSEDKYRIINGLTWKNVKPFSILTGLNGTGKSKVLEYLNSQNDYDTILISGNALLEGSWYEKATRINLKTESTVIYFMHRIYLRHKVPQSNNEDKNLVFDCIKKGREKMENGEKVFGDKIELNDKDIIDSLKCDIGDKEPVPPDLFELIERYSIVLKDFEKGIDAIPDKGYFEKQENPFLIKLNKYLEEAQFKYKGVIVAQKENKGVALLKFAEVENESNIIEHEKMSSGEKSVLGIQSLLCLNECLKSDGLNQSDSEESNQVRKERLLLLDESDQSLDPAMYKMFYDCISKLWIKFNVRVILVTHRMDALAYAPHGDAHIGIYTMKEDKKTSNPVIEETGKIDSFLNITKSGRDVNRKVINVHTESIDDMHFHTKVYQELLNEELGKKVDEKYLEVDGDVYRRFSKRFPLEFHSVSITHGSSDSGGGGCTQVARAINRKNTSYSKKKNDSKEIFGDKEFSKVYGLVDGDNNDNSKSKDPDDVQYRIVRLKRYSFENFLYDPFIFCLAIGDEAFDMKSSDIVKKRKDVKDAFAEWKESKNIKFRGSQFEEKIIEFYEFLLTEQKLETTKEFRYLIEDWSKNKKAHEKTQITVLYKNGNQYEPYTFDIPKLFVHVKGHSLEPFGEEFTKTAIKYLKDFPFLPLDLVESYLELNEKVLRKVLPIVNQRKANELEERLGPISDRLGPISVRKYFTFTDADRTKYPLLANLKEWKNVKPFSIITGKNGVGKTQLLKYIKSNMESNMESNGAKYYKDPKIKVENETLTIETLTIDKDGIKLTTGGGKNIKILTIDKDKVKWTNEGGKSIGVLTIDKNEVYLTIGTEKLQIWPKNKSKKLTIGDTEIQKSDSDKDIIKLTTGDYKIELPKGKDKKLIDVLILDQPIANLDAEGFKTFYDVLNEQHGIQIFMATNHIESLSFLPKSSRIGIYEMTKDGDICIQSREQILKSTSIISLGKLPENPRIGIYEMTENSNIHLVSRDQNGTNNQIEFKYESLDPISILSGSTAAKRSEFLNSLSNKNDSMYLYDLITFQSRLNRLKHTKTSNEVKNGDTPQLPTTWNGITGREVNVLKLISNSQSKEKLEPTLKRIKELLIKEDIQYKKILPFLNLSYLYPLNAILKKLDFPYKAKIITNNKKNQSIVFGDNDLKDSELSYKELIVLNLALLLYQVEHLPQEERSKNIVLLFDSPDLVLHPECLHEFIDILKKFIEYPPRFKVIMTTHRTNLILEAIDGYFNIKRKGWENDSNLCYINATLQALLGFKSFWFGIFNPFLDRIPKENCTLRDNLRSTLLDNSSLRNATSIREAVGKNNNIFGNKNQQDAHEFLVAFLNQLSNILTPGLLVVRKLQYSYSQSHNMDIPFEERATLLCPIKRHFGGMLRTVIECKQCNNNKVNDEKFLEISLPFPSSNGSSSDKKTLPLDDLLTKYFENEDIESTCSCGHNTASSIRKIIQAPRILILHLKRYVIEGNTASKLSYPVSFPMTLDIKKFCSDDSHEPIARVEHLTSSLSDLKLHTNNQSTLGTTDESVAQNTANEKNNFDEDDKAPSKTLPPSPLTFNYDLHSVINHCGEQTNEGHYTTHARDPSGWVLCNDTTIKKEEPNFKGSSDAYIFFYIHKKTVEGDKNVPDGKTDADDSI